MKKSILFLTVAVIFCTVNFVFAQQINNSAGVAKTQNIETVANNDDIKYLQSQINNLNSLISEKESKTYGQILNYSSQSLQHSKDTINYFLWILGLLTGFGFWFGWKTFKDIKTRAHGMTVKIARQETEKVIKKLDDRVNSLSVELKKKSSVDILFREAEEAKSITMKLQLYDRIIQQDPKNYRAYGSKGLIFSKIGKLKEAEGLFKKALEINQKDIVAIHNLGMVSEKLGKYIEAIEFFNKAIEINPKDDLSYFFKGRILFRKLNKPDDAVQFIDKAIEINPEDVYYLHVKAHALLEKKNYSGALELFKEAKKKEIESDDDQRCDYCNYAINISYTYNRMGRFQEAYKEAGRGISINFKIELIVNKGLAAAGLGRKSEAIELLDWAIEEDPENGEIYYCKARALSILEDSVNAIELLKQAVKIDKKWAKRAKEEVDFKNLFNLDDFKKIINNNDFSASSDTKILM